jgi:hypothetical protein
MTFGSTPSRGFKSMMIDDRANCGPRRDLALKPSLKSPK